MIVSFHPLAERELNDAAQYYEMESQGLGSAFLAEGHAIRGTVRRRLIARFPYAILYTLRADVVRVVAVMNLKRRPGYWVGRT